MLRDRFGVELLIATWESKNLIGGTAMDEATLSSLQSAAYLYDDTTVTLYETETIDNVFRPLDINLTSEGLQTLRSSRVSHFNLVWVPFSRSWALVTNVQMDTYVCGPQNFVDSVHDQF